MMRSPAPAATIAAVVLTLKTLWPSPPVPTMSARIPASSPSTCGIFACWSSTSAAAASVLGRRSTPVSWSALRNAPICAWVAAGGDATRCSTASRTSSAVKSADVACSFRRSGLNVSGVCDAGDIWQ